MRFGIEKLQHITNTHWKCEDFWSSSFPSIKVYNKSVRFKDGVNAMNKKMIWFISQHANTKNHVSEHSWSSVWVILSILAHLAHLAQSYFSLIFSAINTYNCSGLILTNKKICSDWRQKFGGKWPMLTTFFLTAIAAITGKRHHILNSAWVLLNFWLFWGSNFLNVFFISSTYDNV